MGQIAVDHSVGPDVTVNMHRGVMVEVATHQARLHFPACTSTPCFLLQSCTINLGFTQQ
jgi:hypothetical protein